MRRRSFFISIGVIFSISLLLYTYIQVENASRDNYAQLTLLREKQVLAYLKLAEQYRNPSEVDYLQEVLKDAVEARMVDWYLLRYKGNHLASYPSGVEKLEDISLQADLAVITPMKSYQSVELSPDLLLTIGINKRLEDYLKVMFEHKKELIIQDMVIPVLIILFLIFIFLGDILRMIKSLSLDQRSNRAQTVLNTKVMSKEAEILKQSLSGYEDIVSEVDKERQLFKQVTLPGLKHELKSGRKVPYEFRCTLVRMDINHFSQMFATHDRDVLLGLINEYFISVSEVVSFYGGYVHEFIGDEVIFYFKDEECSSMNTALACIRDIFVCTEKMSDRFQNQLSTHLSVKAAMTHGVLRFGQMMNSYHLSGRPLIETVRDLSQATLRENNRCYLSSIDTEKIKDICQIEGFGLFDLRGIPEPVDIYLVSRFYSFLEIWPKIKSGQLDLIAYFREDAARPLLDLALELVRNQQWVLSEKLLLIWAQHHPPRLNDEWILKFEKLLNKIIDSGQESLVVERAFSQLVQKWGEQMGLRERLQGMAGILLKRPDSQVIANSIHFLRKTSVSKQLYWKLNEQFSNIKDARVRIQILLLGLSQYYHPKLLDTFESMLKSRDSEEASLAQNAFQEMISDLDQFKELPLQAVHRIEEVKKAA